MRSRTILQNRLIATHGRDSKLARAVGREAKWLSLAGYIVAFRSRSSGRSSPTACYVLVALTWLVPDKRIERQLQGDHAH